MLISWTRLLLEAALDGSLDRGPFLTDPHFGLSIPTSVKSVPPEILDPVKTWESAETFSAQARTLVGMFIANFAF